MAWDILLLGEVHGPSFPQRAMNTIVPSPNRLGAISLGPGHVPYTVQ